MSVFVKKMKMPENCYDCSSFGLNVGLTMFDGICPFCIKIIPDYDMKTGRHPDCPLIEIPPHGNLIDRWELTETALIDPDGGRRKGERRMDDTIYREAAVKHLKHRLYETATNNPDIAGVFSEIADNRVETWIEELPSAQQRWIPVTERLPEEGVMVLVTCYGRDMIIMRDGESLEDAIERVREEVVNVTIGLVGSDGWYGADYFPMIITPIAWMPLPEPYKEEEDE